MQFVSIRVITLDVGRLVAFYEKVTEQSADWATPDFAELHLGGATLAIAGPATVAPLGPAGPTPGVSRGLFVEFLVDDVDAAFDRVRAFVAEIVLPPTTMPWGNRSLVFRDPDGTLVNLFTPVTPAARAKFGADDVPAS